MASQVSTLILVASLMSTTSCTGVSIWSYIIVIVIRYSVGVDSDNINIIFCAFRRLGNA